jgi:cardiolipin synthase A/B
VIEITEDRVLNPQPPRVSIRRRAHARIRRIATGALLAVAMTALGSCASVPDVEPVLAQAENADGKPQLVGARGPLSAAQSKAVLDKLRVQTPDSDILGRHQAIMEVIADSPLVVGNRTRILRDGVPTFAAMFDAIRNARKHINLEYYIFEDVESGGERLGDLLLAKSAQGVQVNIIYDSYGSSATPAAFFDRLKAGGINVLEFNPINPFAGKAAYSLNNRDHRKILIADGATAFVGGVNLSTTHEVRRFARSGAIEGMPSGFWRDTDLQIDGPAVAELQKLFLEHWSAQKGPELTQADFFPTNAAKGGEVVRTLGSAPKDETPRYYVAMLSAIRNAEERIWLATAYFVPTKQAVLDLEAAARRGVDVRLLLPGESDSQAALILGRSNYRQLLEAGVRIFETSDMVLHSKTVVVDGVWSMIGSSNFDHRSVIHNDEVDTVVLGRETGRQMEAMFEEDFKQAAQVELEAWKARPLTTRIKEIYYRIWQNQL